MAEGKEYSLIYCSGLFRVMNHEPNSARLNVEIIHSVFRTLKTARKDLS